MPNYLKAAFWGAVLGLGLCITISGLVWADAAPDAMIGAGLCAFGVFLSGVAILGCVDTRGK